MLAYYYEESDDDKTGPHRGQDCPVSELDKIGVLYMHGDEKMVDAIAAERHYVNRDIVTLNDTNTPNLDTLLDKFFVEHMHEDEEIRYILDGTGYFDVRSAQDVWIRVVVQKGDLLVLPAGLYHRFTVDGRRQLQALRLFQAEPNWIAHARE